MARFWEDNNETINNRLTSLMTDMENTVKPRQDKYIKWYRLYNGIILDSEKREYGANLFINYTLPTIDTLVSRCLQTLFRQKPYSVIDPKNIKYKENAKYMQAKIEHDLDNKINIIEKWYNLLLEVFLYGTSIPYTDWKLEKKTIKQWEDVILPVLDIPMGRKAVSKEITVYDAPIYEITDIFNVYVPSAAKDIKDAEPLAIRNYLTPEEFKQRIEKGIYDKKVAAEITDEANPFTEIEKVRQQQSGTGDTVSQKRIKIDTFYFDERIITRVNSRYIVQNKENPSFSMEKPFDRVVWHPLPNEFWGKSLAEVVESLQLELNTTRNQRIDNVSLVLNKLFGYDKNSDIDPNDIYSKAGHAIPMNTKGDLWTIDTPDVTASAYQEEATIKQDIQFITFVNDYAMGRTTAGSSTETATAVRNKTESSNMNFNTVVMLLNTTGLMPLYDKLIKLNYQYMDRPENVKIQTSTGTETKEITREMITGDYGLLPANPNFELPMSKEVKRQDLIYLLDTISRINPAVTSVVNLPAYLKKVFELYDIKDYEELIQQVPQTPPQPQPGNPAPEQINAALQANVPTPDVMAQGNTMTPDMAAETGVEQNGFS